MNGDVLASMGLFGVWYNWILPAWIAILGGVVATGAFFAASATLTAISPKTAAVARTTAKEAFAQPLFWVELMLGIVLLLLFMVIPYNTFGDDIKVLKDTGLTLILLLAMILAVWTASVSIADELEGRTALTLLSKPVSRRQFLVGKFFGVLGPVAVLYIVLGVIFLITVSYKVTYDAREMAQLDPSWIECRDEMLLIVPGLFLAFLETMVLTSISVAIATRLPLVPNLVICFSIYVVGHLVPLLVQSSLGRDLPLIAFTGQALAAVLPVLDHFSVQAAVAAGRTIPWLYVAWAALYAVIYSTLAMLIALLLFENRDLA